MELHHPVPHLPPLDALVTGRADLLVVPFFSNERPLCGLGGHLDWELRGQMSQWIQSGAASGAAGEWLWTPIFRQSLQTPAKILWVGCGDVAKAGARSNPSASIQNKIQEGLQRETGRLVWVSQEWGGWGGPTLQTPGLERVDLG